MDLIIKNGILIAGGEAVKGDIAVNNGKIAAIGDNLSEFCSAERTIDAQERLVTPGGVDVHAHMSYHVAGCDTTDTFASGTLAALFGGTTTTMDFVEALPEETLQEALDRRRAQAEKECCTDFSLHMSILPSDMDKLDQVFDLTSSGCPSFKHYTAYGFALDDLQLCKSLQTISEAHGLAVVHAENWGVIQALVAKHLRYKHTDASFHPLCRPAEFEAEAVHRVLELARLTRAEIFLFHQSCRQDIDEIIQARRDGLTVYAETCPHYTCLDSSIFHKMGNLPVCSPPIREEGHQKPLAQALINGFIDSVSSDHCPFTRAEKNRAQAFNQVPGGLSSVETRMMLIKDLPGMSLGKWVEVCCANPAKIVGLNCKGQINIGFDADIVVWSREPYTIKAETLHEKADWSPYENYTVSSHPETVISRGETVIDNGRFLGKTGRGRYIERFLKH
ncbi:amidohydrolase family protein [bacterium]|nr:amidohydrolase family protein [bacterium]